MLFLDNLPTELRTEYAVVYEARAVYDTASLRLSDYAAHGGTDWVVAVVTPTPGSGSATVPGAYIEAETGKFHAPPGASAVLVKQGTWQALAVGDPGTPRQASYAWTEPLEGRARVPSPEDYYSPFAYGGTLVFRPEPQAEGSGRFAACRLIFADWGTAAVEALRAAPRFAPASGPAAGATAPGTTIGNANGLLATLAFHAWLHGGAAEPAQGQALLATADARRLSTFVYLILTESATANRSDWNAQLGRAIQAIRGQDKLEAITYAAYAVVVFLRGEPAAIGAARRVLAEVRQQADALGIPLSDDSPLQVVFEKSGILDQ